MNRSELKSIIKECLIEILQESGGSSSLKEGTRRTGRTESEVHAASNSSARLTRFTPKQAAAPKRSDLRTTPTSPNVASLTSDPVMASILADTANTTLKKKIQAESAMDRISSGPNLNLDDPGIPVEEVFEEGAGKWAALAFGSSPRR